MCDILVVEPNAKLRTAIFRLLTDAGYNVDAAASTEQAVALAHKSSYVLAVIDVRLEQGLLKGFEVIDQTNSDLKYIIVTGVNSPEARERAQEYNVSKYIIKPYNEVELITAVDEFVYDRRDEKTKGRKIGDEVNLNHVYDRLSVVRGRLENLRMIQEELSEKVDSIEDFEHKRIERLTKIETHLESTLERTKEYGASLSKIESLTLKVEKGETNWGRLINIGLFILQLIINIFIVSRLSDIIG